MLVWKHIDGDISFMESSQHITGYYGVDLLMNNALGDIGADCLWNSPYGCHKDKLLLNEHTLSYYLFV